MAVDDSRGDVDEFAVVRPGTLVKHREGGLLTDRVALHQDPFGALNDSTAAKRAFEIVVLGKAAQHDVDLSRLELGATLAAALAIGHRWIMRRVRVVFARRGTHGVPGFKSACRLAEPTPGLEPGTPSLRVKCSTS
jgi:hypothetical protein